MTELQQLALEQLAHEGELSSPAWRAQGSTVTWLRRRGYTSRRIHRFANGSRVTLNAITDAGRAALAGAQ